MTDTFTQVLEWIGRLEAAWAPKNERAAIQEDGCAQSNQSVPSKTAGTKRLASFSPEVAGQSNLAISAIGASSNVSPLETNILNGSSLKPFSLEETARYIAEIQNREDGFAPRGSGRGAAPHFPCQTSSKWDKISGPPRAIIPPLPEVDLTPQEQRESFEETPQGELVHPKAIHIKPKVEIQRDAQGNVVQVGDGTGKNQEQAKALANLDLDEKAQSLFQCGTIARMVKCDCCGHFFFHRNRCMQRFCPGCAVRLFKRDFEKYIPLKVLVEKRKHWVLARLDFTDLNLFRMPTPTEIKKFNKGVRRALRAYMRGIVGWGYMFVDEMGEDNTNLHAHGIYYGPWIVFEELKARFAKEMGMVLRISVKFAGMNFASALAHMLKYVSKCPSNNPKRRAELENAFVGVKRVHVMGIFYNPDLTTDKNAPSGNAVCPDCGLGRLVPVGAYVLVAELEAMGLKDAEEVRRARDGPGWVN